MAGATVYPGALDNFAESSPTNLGDNDSTGRTHAERHDDIESAMEALPSPLLVKQESLLFHIGLDNT